MERALTVVAGLVVVWASLWLLPRQAEELRPHVAAGKRERYERFVASGAFVWLRIAAALIGLALAVVGIVRA